jgi:hypothetical protein
MAEGYYRNSGLIASNGLAAIQEWLLSALSFPASMTLMIHSAQTV